MIDVSKLLANYAANKLPDGKIRDQHSYVDGGIQHSYVDGGGCPATLGNTGAVTAGDDRLITEEGLI